MNAQEITDIIKALGPAGEAMHSTAYLFIAKEILGMVLIPVSVVVIIFAISKAFMAHRLAEMADNTRSEFKRLTGAVKINSAMMDYADNEAVLKALEAYFERSKVETAPLIPSRFTYYKADKAAVSGLITFLEGK